MKNLYKITSLLMSGALLLGVVSPVYAEEELKVMAEPVVAEEPVVSVEAEPVVAEEPVVSVEAEPIVAEDPVVSVEPEEPIVAEEPIVEAEPIVAEEAEELMEESHPLPEFTMNRLYTDCKGNFWTDEDYIVTNRAETIEVNADLVEESVVFVEDEEPIVAEEPVVSVEPEEPVVSVDPEQPEAEERSFTINIDYNFIEKTTTDSDFSNMYDDLLQEIETFVYSNFKNVDNFYIENKEGVEFTPDMLIQDLVVVINYKIEIGVPDEPDKDDDDFNNTGGTVKKDKCDLTLKKVILNKSGEEATEEDFEEMGLDIDDTFTFKIVLTNVETGDIYNILLDNKEEQTISGLKVGTYKIEEIDDNYFDNVGFEFSTADEDHDSLLEEKADGYYITICNCGKIEHTANITVENELEEHRGYEDKDEEENLFWVPKQDEGNIPSLTPDWWDYQISMGWIDKDFASLGKKENN